ncbi:MAG: c-type cytochrome [Qingshengfaniella sp.]
MLDTMTMTKTVGALCGSLLVFLLGGWLGTALYTTGGGHGEGAEQAYVIETLDVGGGGEAEEQVDFNELVATASAASGERVFNKCKACHKLDGTNTTGPHLDGVVNRQKAAVGGFAYSDVMNGMSGDVWTLDNLNHFLESPRSYAPGTKMSFAGLKKVQDRADLVAYLETITN